MFYFPESFVLPLNMLEGGFITPYGILNIKTHFFYMLILGLLIGFNYLLRALSRRYHKVLPMFQKLN